jgi:hypothetical protein
MRLSTQQKTLGELVFYSDILKHFTTLEDYRNEGESNVFWHKSGEHYFSVDQIMPGSQQQFVILSNGTSRDPRYAVVKLFSTSLKYYFDSRWGHTNSANLVYTLLLAPKGAPPKPFEPILVGGTNILGGTSGTVFFDGTTIAGTALARTAFSGGATISNI